MTEAQTRNFGGFLGRILLILFLFSIFLPVRKVFFFYPPLGADPAFFNEYTDISLYFSDIAFLFFFGYIILENKNYILSISWWREMFHVEHIKFILFSPAPFLLWALISTFWAENAVLAIYSWIRLFESYLVYLSVLLYFVPRGTFSHEKRRVLEKCSTWNKYLLSFSKKILNTWLLNFQKNVPRGTIYRYIQKCSTWNKWEFILGTIVILAFIQAVIGICQFLFQGSVGITFLQESHFSVRQTGVAKIIYDGTELIRPYGLLPHPNVLSMILGISLLILIAYPHVFNKKMFHVEQIWFYRVVYGVIFLAFLLSFSKSGLFGFILSIYYVFLKMFHVEQKKVFLQSSENVPRGTNLSWRKICFTWNKSLKRLKMFHVEHFTLSIILLGGIFLILFKQNVYFLLLQPLQERYFLLTPFFEVLKYHFFQGVGIGQSVLIMQSMFHVELLDWQFQPVHNYFLNIWIELGLVGLMLYLYFFLGNIILVLKNVPRGTSNTSRSLYFLWMSGILFLLPALLFDHFLYDIQNGMLFFWMWMSLGGALSFHEEH